MTVTHKQNDSFLDLKTPIFVDLRHELGKLKCLKIFLSVSFLKKTFFWARPRTQTTKPGYLPVILPTIPLMRWIFIFGKWVGATWVGSPRGIGGQTNFWIFTPQIICSIENIPLSSQKYILTLYDSQRITHDLNRSLRSVSTFLAYILRLPANPFWPVKEGNFGYLDFNKNHGTTSGEFHFRWLKVLH